MRSISLGLLLFSVILPVALPWSAAQVSLHASATDNMNGVAMIASNNGWIVGNAGTVEHFDGSSWSLIPSGTISDLFGISFGPPGAPNANAGFAVGGSGGTAMALFWSGVSWFPTTTGLSAPDAQKLSSVSALSPSDAWAVDSISGAFWHWSGTAGMGGGWDKISSASSGLNSVFMTSATDGWAIGVGGTIYHYTGGGWTLFTTVGQTLNSVFMLNQNEGWAVGNGGVIYHYSSGIWIGPVSPAPTNQDLKSVFLVSQTEGWAVGASGVVLHYSNGAWSAVPSNLLATTQNLNAVSFSGGTGWAVGDVGTIISLGAPTPQGVPAATFESVYLSSSNEGWIVGCSTGGCGSGAGEPTVVHWSGSSFTRGSVSAITSDLYSVFMANPSDGWAVGGLGTTPVILHYTGGSWAQVPAPSANAVLRSVFMVDASNGWAVGDSGVILRYSGGGWGAMSTPTSNTLRSLFMLDSSDGWAVGDGGTILRYQGLSGQWATYPSPTSARLNAVFLLDSSHGWAVGAAGTILHYDGSLWLSVPDLVATNLNSVAQLNPQEAWVVGDSGTILHWSGVSWYPFTPVPPLSGNPDLNSIFVIQNGFGFIVGAPPAPGSQGTILQAPAMNPIPELPDPGILLAVALMASLVMISSRRRNPRRETR